MKASETRNKGGRPKKNPEDLRVKSLRMMLTSHDMEAVRMVSKLEDMQMADFSRLAVMKYCESVISKAKRNHRIDAGSRALSKFDTSLFDLDDDDCNITLNVNGRKTVQK